MVDFFLILGRVPGTDYQITFNQLLILVALALLFLFWRKRYYNLIPRFVARYRWLYLLTEKGTQLRLPL